MRARINPEHIDVFKDIKKSALVYGLREVKKMDYGYSAKLRWMSSSLNVFAYVKGNQVKIVEENGKFVVTVDLAVDAEVKVDCVSISSIVFKPMEWRIAKNLEKYSSFLNNVNNVKSMKERKTRIQLFASTPMRRLDLRGVTCPVPEIETKKAILSAKPYETIEVLVDNPPAIMYTLPEVAKSFNCKYEIEDNGDYATFTFICGGTADTPIDLSRVKDIIRDERGIGKLYMYFNKIKEERNVESFLPSFLEAEGKAMIVASPEGRGWLLTAVIEGNKLISARLDYGNTKLFDEDAINMVTGNVGLIHIFYLIHDDSEGKNHKDSDSNEGGS
ncbi:sulfurtransferase TusA family protein [Sulfuracidifex metallicus]|uniref:UPF0033 domain-containing protein n=1 Tax=Sulfuracidifex metallicus DSM 6482 = JCM 9184 TaxID=523847 RepID=A0A6A9QVC7_SULME|nr:sulfurtransferase TusA family protein [Sulfuracidifex metallicus]MUN29022.1 hypothetical protein [Sulfuracidifex metallicus DSM 6482 = JCM 9184]WOE50468.1 sulfurtransferase TusA family protein [Sulfuracidifex metallicus DSM 6482 = JCM 9184]